MAARATAGGRGLVPGWLGVGSEVAARVVGRAGSWVR
jgi:hypothetical protein